MLNANVAFTTWQPSLFILQPILFLLQLILLLLQPNMLTNTDYSVQPAAFLLVMFLSCFSYS
jgi:hypothetical protein